ncbi:TEL2-interacting protein 1 [Smittium culicis]|uniref:TEL2-interacting protein 1 n=1 Tax=Smittium culicis TaxID=133412 RepID=A0A1R1YS17_9FUNG|nr:TEL2-interacting protein 1 [Smittium culicis]
MQKPILIFNPPNPSQASNPTPEFNPSSLFSTINAYFLHPKNYNFLAYCICGLLDNSADPTQPEASEISLDVLLNLLSQSHQFKPLTLNPANDYQPSFLSNRNTLKSFFPGLVSSLIKISIGKPTKELFQKSLNPSILTANYKPHIRAKSIKVLSCIIQLCFNNSSYFLENTNNIIISDPSCEPKKYLSPSEIAKLARASPLIAKNDTFDDITLAQTPLPFNLLNIKNDSWEYSSISKLSQALKSIVHLRHSDNLNLVSELLSLFGNILSNCYIFLSQLIPISLQVLLLSQFKNCPSHTSLSLFYLNNFISSAFNSAPKAINRLDSDISNYHKRIHSHLLIWYKDLLQRLPFFLSNDDYLVQSEDSSRIESTASPSTKFDPLSQLSESTVSNIFEFLIDECSTLVTSSVEKNSKNVSLKVLSVQSFETYSESELKHINTVLSTLKEIISFKKHQVIYYLSDLIFPLLALMQKSSSKTKNLVTECLQSISVATGANGVQNLLAENADFIVDKCSQRIRRFSFSFDVFNVLTSTINLMDPQEAITISSDVVDDVLDVIESIVKNGILISSTRFTSSTDTISSANKLNSISLINTETAFDNQSNGLLTLIKCLDFLNIVTEKIKAFDPHDLLQIENVSDKKVDLLMEKLKSRKDNNKIFSETYSLDSKLDEFNDADESIQEEDTKVAKPNQKISIKIMMVVQNFISHTNTHVQLLSLKILQNVIMTLSDTNELLPLINHVWPIIISCLSDPEYNNSNSFYITLACLKLISELCFYAKDWLLSRINSDIWPCFYNQLSAVSSPFNKQLMLNNASGLYSKPHVEDRPSLNPTTSIVVGYLKTLSSIFENINIGYDISLSASLLIARFLDKSLNETVSEAALNSLVCLSRQHSDTVWLVLFSFGDIEYPAFGNSKRQNSQPTELVCKIPAKSTLSLRKRLAKRLLFV